MSPTQVKAVGLWKKRNYAKDAFLIPPDNDNIPCRGKDRRKRTQFTCFNKYNTGLTSQSWKIQLFFERLRGGTGGGQRKYLTMSHSNHM